MSKSLGDYPVYAHGRPVGSVMIAQDGLMTVFDCACSYQSREILRLAAISGGKTVPIGVVAPEAGSLHLRKRLSKNALAALGYTGAESFHLIGPEEVHEEDTGQSGPPEPVYYIDWPDPPDIPEDAESEPQPEADNYAPGTTDPDMPASGTPVSDTPVNLGNLDDLTAKLGPMLEQLLKSSEKQEPPSPDGWSQVSHPGALFIDTGIAAACDGVTGALLKAQDGYQLLAIPVSPDEPFPMMSVFCFGSSGQIDGHEYIIFKIMDGNLTL